MRRGDLIASVLLGLAALAGCGRVRDERPAQPAIVPVQTPEPSPPPVVLTAESRLVQRLAPGQTRRYELSLRRGQYLEAVIQQNGVDVVVRVLDPLGNLLLRVDSPNAAQGPEELFLVADTAGRHLLEIEAAEGTGSYEVRVEALRAAAPEDRKRAAAAVAYSHARLFEKEGKTASAAGSYQEAARLWGEVGSEAHEAWSLFRLGKLFVDDSARRRDVVEALDRALALFRRVGDRRQEATTLTYLGRVWGDTEEIERASRNYEQALALLKHLEGKLFDEATCLNDLAILRVRQGRLQAAIDLYSQAVGVWQRQGDRRSEATTRTNLGFLYASLGEGLLALDQYRHALALLDVRPEPADVAMQRAVTLNKLGDALLWIEGPEPALAYLREALDLRLRQHDTSGQAVTLNSIGLARLEADRPREALEAFRSAGDIFRRLGNEPAQAIVLNNLGIAYERLGFPARARESFERGLALDANGAGAMTAVFGLARMARMEGHLDEAEQRMEQVLDLVEGVRSQVWRPDLRSSYQAARQKQYSFLLDLLAEQHQREPGRGYAARAFAVSERARARSLLDLLSAARAHPDPEEVRRLDGLSRRINSRHLDLLTSPRGIASSELESELASLLESWRQASAEVRGPLPAAAASLSLPQAQRLLEEGTLLLEYFLGEERSYLWAVTPTTVRFVSNLPGRERIEGVARQAYNRITKSHLQTEQIAARQAAERLSQMVLKPVADLLDRPRLVVVPHGALQAIPFAALPRPDGTDRPLIVDHEIVSLPSVSVLAALRSKRADHPSARGLLAVVADPVLGADDKRLPAFRPAVAADRNPTLPRLPYAQREAQEILDLAGPGRVLSASGFEASRKLIQSGRLSGYRILHFATHGLFDDLHPELSALALSAFDPSGRPIDGQFRAYEVSSLDLRADLVVLSACRTALGREVGGEGMVGLTQGFLYAGASRLIVSLWDVDDRSTSELMKRFYTGLLLEKLPPAEALRRAQVSLWKETRWHSPFYWAGFVLEGEWR